MTTDQVHNNISVFVLLVFKNNERGTVLLPAYYLGNSETYRRSFFFNFLTISILIGCENTVNSRRHRTVASYLQTVGFMHAELTSNLQTDLHCRSDLIQHATLFCGRLWKGLSCRRTTRAFYSDINWLNLSHMSRLLKISL